MFNRIRTVTRNVTVTGDWFTVDRAGNEVVELARDLDMEIVCDETFDDASPYVPVEHTAHTVWFREVRVRGSRRDMRALTTNVKDALPESELASVA
jgi:hypothetical protein